MVEVTPLAAQKSDIKVGDEVMALIGGGGYAGMPLLLTIIPVITIGATTFNSIYVTSYNVCTSTVLNFSLC